VPDEVVVKPKKLDLKRDERLRIEWTDGLETTLPVATLRQMCPCANCKIARDGVDPHQLMRPMTSDEVAAAQGRPKKRSLKLNVVKESMTGGSDVAVTKAEMVGNYAMKLWFTDGHDSGIFTWSYLRELSAKKSAAQAASSGESGGSGGVS
jgi:DUF971 family protein